MKKRIVMTLAILFLGVSSLLSQAPPPPPGDAGTGGGPVGGPIGSPIDGGLGILLALGAVYGGRKLYKAKYDKKLVDREPL
jgi:hypothetical protein